MEVVETSPAFVQLGLILSLALPIGRNAFARPQMKLCAPKNSLVYCLNGEDGHGRLDDHAKFARELKICAQKMGSQSEVRKFDGRVPLQQVFEDLEKLGPDAPPTTVTLMFLNHGGGGRSDDKSDNKYLFWGDEAITQNDFQARLSKISPKHRVMIFHDSCMAGAFLKTSDPLQSAVTSNRCAFAGADSNELSSNTYEAALADQDSVKDEDGDGCLSAEEIHRAYSRYSKKSGGESTALSSSEVFLQSYYQEMLRRRSVTQSCLADSSPLTASVFANQKQAAKAISDSMRPSAPSAEERKRKMLSLEADMKRVQEDIRIFVSQYESESQEVLEAKVQTNEKRLVLLNDYYVETKRLRMKLILKDFKSSSHTAALTAKILRKRKSTSRTELEQQMNSLRNAKGFEDWERLKTAPGIGGAANWVEQLYDEDREFGAWKKKYGLESLTPELRAHCAGKRTLKSCQAFLDAETTQLTQEGAQVKQFVSLRQHLKALEDLRARNSASSPNPEDATLMDRYLGLRECEKTPLFPAQ